jgi:hypothetical protein
VLTHLDSPSRPWTPSVQNLRVDFYCGGFWTVTFISLPVLGFCKPRCFISPRSKLSIGDEQQSLKSYLCVLSGKEESVGGRREGVSMSLNRN